MAEPLQYSLPLSTPADHFGIIHPGRSARHDHILWSPRQKKAWHKILPNQNLEVVRDQLARYTSQPEIFLTPNGFYNWRLLVLLRSLNSVYLDFDSPGVDPRKKAAQICLQCEDLGIPRPSAFVYSARGPHAYWFIQETPAAALPRWQTVERYLGRALGADPRAMDATRVLRVTGTVHGTTGKMVEAEIIDPHVWDFDALADNILPFTRKRLRELREERKGRRGRPKKGDMVPFRRHSSILNWLYLLTKDIEYLCDSLWLLSGEEHGSRIPEGWRDTMLFLYAVAWAHFAPTEERLMEEAMQFHRYWTHSEKFSDREAKGYLKSVLNRFRMNQNGVKIVWQGQLRSPLYQYRKNTILEILDPLLKDRPDIVSGLRALVPDDVRRERQLEAKEKKRRDAGSVPRTRYLLKAEERRQKASSLRAQGLSWKDVGKEMGVGAEAARKLASRKPDR